jgi:glycosyltransferase involved in cell wall biosynthesis
MTGAMASSPCVSIIVPVYNCADYLRPCLDSLVGQTLKDIEILCVNDGSTDTSPAILDEYAAKDPRIRVITKRNEGQAVARNIAIGQARGEYLVFADSDDLVDTTLCEKVYSCAHATGADLVLYDFVKFEELPDGSRTVTPDEQNFPKSADDRSALLHQMGVVWTKCIRTEFMRGQKILFPEHRIHEDIFVHWMTIVLARSIALLDEKLYHYRVRPNATTLRADWKMADRLFVLDQTREALLGHGVYGTYRATFLQIQLTDFAWLYDVLHGTLKSRFGKLIDERLHDDEWEFIRNSGALETRVTDFYRARKNEVIPLIRRLVWLTTRKLYRILTLQRNQRFMP